MQRELATDCDGSVKHEKWQEPAGTLSMALTAYSAMPKYSGLRTNEVHELSQKGIRVFLNSKVHNLQKLISTQGRQCLRQWWKRRHLRIVHWNAYHKCKVHNIKNAGWTRKKDKTWPLWRGGQLPWKDPGSAPEAGGFLTSLAFLILNIITAMTCSHHSSDEHSEHVVDTTVFCSNVTDTCASLCSCLCIRAIIMKPANKNNWQCRQAQSWWSGCFPFPSECMTEQKSWHTSK